MKTLQSRTFRGVTTDLYTTGKFYCTCKEFKESRLHCEHTRQMLAEMSARTEKEKE